MPTYEYTCTTCGHRLDAVQKFSDEPLTVCPECGGALRKVFGAVGIVLKGSGFYKTDSRAASGKAGANGNGNGKEPKGADASPGDSKSDSKSEAGTKPESATPAPTGEGPAKGTKAPVATGS